MPDRIKVNFREHESKLRDYAAAENKREDLEKKYAQLFKDYRRMSKEYWRANAENLQDNKKGILDGYRRFKEMEDMVRNARNEIAEQQNIALGLRRVFIKTAERQSKKSGKIVIPLTWRRDEQEIREGISDLIYQIDCLKLNLSKRARDILDLIYTYDNIVHIELAYTKREMGLGNRLSADIREFLSDVDLFTETFTEDELQSFRNILKYSSIVRQLKLRVNNIEG